MSGRGWQLDFFEDRGFGGDGRGMGSGDETRYVKIVTMEMYPSSQLQDL